MAVCGGVTVILSPIPFITLSKARMASESGQCKTYSADADGYVRSEGCGVIILKNLQMAIEDGDMIWGIMTTVSNSDGKATNPMTAPSADMQAALMRYALKKAHIEAHQIDFVEMHGTGTPVGDPVECSSVGKVMGESRKTKGLAPCPVGSVKTNVGHLEAAAGPAGIIKVLLMMKYGKITPSILFGKLNPNLNLDQLHLDVVLEVREWPHEKKNRIASVNSFGFGGSNVHAIIQTEAKNNYPKQNIAPQKDYVVLFTGQDTKSLVDSANDTRKAIKYGSVQNLQNLSYTGCYFRTHYQYRKAFAVKSLHELQNKAKNIENLVSSLQAISSRFQKPKNVVMVFCGMGTHWSGMGLQMYESNTVFRATIDELRSLFDTLGKFDIIDCLKGEKDLKNPLYGQPAVFACQVALFRLWLDNGISPNTIVGHSVGEVAAAFASGFLSLVEAANLVYYRALAVSQVQGGKMLVVSKLSMQQILSEVEAFKHKVEIAAYNSDTSVTLSGEAQSIETLEKIFQNKYGETIFVRILEVQVAYHSFYMDGTLEHLSRLLKNNFDSYQITNKFTAHVSTVTGNKLLVNEARTAEYWLKNVRQGVLFSTAFQKALIPDTMNVVIEIGPRPALRTNMKEIGQAFSLELLPSMHFSNENLFSQSLEKCYELGAFTHQTKQAQNLCTFPRYVLQRVRMYKEPLKATHFKEGKNALADNVHPFVHKQDDNSQNTAVVCIERSTTPFVFEHKLSGMVLVPGATYVEMGVACIQSFSDELKGSPIQASIKFLKPGVISENKEEMKVTAFLEKSTPCLYSFDVTSSSVLHATGTVQKTIKEHYISSTNLDLASIKARTNMVFSQQDMYEKLAKYNFTYGPSLRCIENGFMNDKEVLVNLRIPPNTDITNTTIHPAVLDTALQIGVVFPAIDLISDGQIIPFGIENILIINPLKEDMLLHVEICEISEHGAKMNAALMTRNGELLVQCFGLTYGIMGKYSNFDINDAIFQMNCRTIDAGATSRIEEGNSLILICPNSITAIFKKHFCMAVEHLEYESAIGDKVQHNHMQFTEILPPNSKDFAGIVYFPYFEMNDTKLEQFSGPEVQMLVFKACFPLIQLVKYLNSTGSSIPVFLVTNGVHKLHSLDEQNVSINTLVGSALIGMARTINKELPFLPFKSIDLDTVTKENLETMQQVISSNDDYFEVSISKGEQQVWALSDSRNKNASLGFPYFYSKNEIGEITHNEQRCFTTPVEPVRSNSLGHERARVIQVFIQNDGHHSPKSPYTCNKDCKLLASDFLIELPHGTIASTYAFHGVASEIYVRKSQVVPKELFPCKLPCLSFWVNAFNLIKKVKNRFPFLLLSQSLDDYQTAALKWVCKLSHINLSQTLDKNKHYGGVIILAKDSKYVTDQLQQLGVETLDIYLLLTGKCNDAQIFTYPSLTRILNPYHVLMSNSHIETINEFVDWLHRISKQDLKEALDSFCVYMERTTRSVHFSELPSVPLHVQVPVLLKFEAKLNGSGIKCLSRQNVFRKEASYIVIGGSKGLGWEVVKHVTSKGAGVICIVSRSGLPKDKLSDVAALENQYQCRIVDMKANVADAQAMENLFREIGQNYYTVRGIFFGAVVASDGLIPSMSMEKFQKPLLAKVTGVWNVYILTKDLELDFFVIHSSIASLLGNAGQTNYGAGNAFEDAIACLRKKQTGIGLSICWGALDLGLLHDNDQAMKKVQSMGLIPLKPNEIMQCLDYGMGLLEESVVCFATFSWKIWSRWVNQSSSLLSKQYYPLLDRHCYYMNLKKTTLPTDSNLQKKEITFATELLKQLLLLDDSEISLDSTLIDLGADSHQMQLFQSRLTSELGLSPDDVPIVKIGQMPISQIFELISPGTSIKEQELSSLQDSTKGKELSTRKDTMETKSIIYSDTESILIPPSLAKATGFSDSGFDDSSSEKTNVYTKEAGEMSQNSRGSSENSSVKTYPAAGISDLTTYSGTSTMGSPTGLVKSGFGSEIHEGIVVSKHYTKHSRLQRILKLHANDKIKNGVVYAAYSGTKGHSASSVCVIM